MNDSNENNANETHTRWQGIALTQLGYSINLILAFSLASLGFGVSWLDGASKSELYLHFCALGSLFFSILAGLTCTITRLYDFRKTRKAARLEWEKNSSCAKDTESEIKELEECAWKLGRRTWRFFVLQLGSFALGFICLAISVAVPLLGRLDRFCWSWLIGSFLVLFIVAPLACWFWPIDSPNRSNQSGA